MARTSSDDLLPQLAESLVCLSPGERIPTLRELARKLHATVASTHVALNRLEELGAIKTTRRGRHGAFLTENDAVRLWLAANRNRGPFLIALPLPTTLLLQGAATAIRTLSLQAGLELSLVFIPGSRTQVMMLRLRLADAVMISRLAADVACGDEEVVVVSMPPGTITKSTQVYSRLRSTGGARIRVAVDSSVPDLVRLTELEFRAANVEIVDARAIQYGTLLNDGYVDAVIAREEDAALWPHGTWYGRSLSSRVVQHIDDADKCAAFVTRTQDPLATAVMRSVIDVEQLLRIQQDVVAGQAAPSF
jgi:hypothetical protein